MYDQVSTKSQVTINDSPVQQSIESKFDKQGIREGSLPRQDILEEFEC